MSLNALHRSIPWAIALGLISMSSVVSAEAALFDQEDVDPERFVAIAVPLPQGERYNLIVLEQKSDAQLCWQETEDEGVIDPLLLGFDFSGICGRSTDSNGYSIRQVGEDLALKYRLSLQKKDGVLVLMGVPLQNAYGKPFEIGRTQVLSDQFMKITLDSDWRLTRRVYQGQSLGHLYFTRDVIPPEPEAPEEKAPEVTLAEALEKLDETLDDVNDAGRTPRADSKSDSEENLAASDEQVQDDLATESQDLAPTATEPASNDPANPLQAPIQIPVPTPPSLINALPSPSPVSRVEPTANDSFAPSTPIPVPDIAPLGQVGASEPDVIVSGDAPNLPTLSAAGGPPAPPFDVALSIKRYRVYVDPRNEAESQAVQTLVSDAFWTSLKGRRLLQVGAFFNKEEADTLIQKLGQQKISGIIDASQY